VPWTLLADLVVIIHFGFVLFCVFGALLCLWWPKVMWIHIPSAIWGGVVEIVGWICPLTPIENWLRQRAAVVSYRDSFADQYIMPLLYPSAANRAIHILMGLSLLLLNLCLYFYIIRKRYYFKGSRIDHFG